MRPLTLVAILLFVVAAPARAGPLADAACGFDPTLFPCLLAQDTEEVIDCQIDFARTIPGMLAKFVDQALAAVSEFVHDVKCKVTHDVYAAYSDNVHNPGCASAGWPFCAGGVSAAAWEAVVCDAVMPLPHDTHPGWFPHEYPCPENPFDQ